MSANLQAMLRFVPGFCVVGLAVLLSASALAATPLIAVTESPANIAPRALRLEIRPTVEASLKDRGASVVPRAKLLGENGKCAGEACVVQVGNATGATHVLVVHGSYVDDGYRLRLQVFDSRTGRELYSDGQVCEVCTYDDLLKALRERTAILWSRIQSEEVTPPAAPLAAPVVAFSPAAAPYHDMALQPSRPSLTRRLVGPSLVIAGLGVAVLGGVYLSFDGSPATDHAGCRGASPCPFSRSTSGWSGPMLGAGLVLAIAGGYTPAHK